MGIYSANRSGMMEASTMIADGEYTSSDLGRIMYESEVNDMAIFEAIIASDLQEAKAIQEGTLLESEAVKFNRQNAEGLLGKIEDRLKRFWAKIKAAIKDVINKIAAYVLRDGKAFAKLFKEKYKGKKFESFDTKVFNTEYEAKKIPAMMSYFSIPVLLKYADKNARSSENKSVKDIVADVFKDCGKNLGLDSSVTTVSEVISNIKEDMYVDGKIGPSDVDKLLSLVENGKKSIAQMKAYNNHIDKDMKSAIDYVRSLSRAKSQDEDAYKLRNAMHACTAFEQLASATTKINIMCVKAQIKQARVNLSEILGNVVQESAVLIEAAALDAAAEVDDAMSPDVTEEIEATPELKDDVEDIVDSAEVDELAESFLY